MSGRQVIKSSRLLYDFYVWWLANKDKVKRTKVIGLCMMAESYLIEVNAPYGAVSTVSNELEAQFKRAGKHWLFPFGQQAFSACVSHQSMHLDPNRIQWVKDRIEDGMIEEEAKEN